MDNNPLRTLNSLLQFDPQREPGCLYRNAPLIVQLLHSGPILSAALSSTDITLQRQVHKFRSTIAVYLQSKELEARWSGVCALNASIHTCDAIILGASGSSGFNEGDKSITTWIRGLLAMLKRPDPAHVLSVAISSLAHILLVLSQSPAKTRELGIPNVPPFASSLISLSVFTISTTALSKPENAIQSEDNIHLRDYNFALLPSVLSAFNKLLPVYPSTFRPFTARLKLLLNSLIIYPDLPSSLTYGTSESVDSDQNSSLENGIRLMWINLSLLSAPTKGGNESHIKQTLSEAQALAWSQGWNQLLGSLWQLSDLLLSGVEEDMLDDSSEWTQTSLNLPRFGNPQQTQQNYTKTEVICNEMDLVNTFERAESLLKLAAFYLSKSTASLGGPIDISLTPLTVLWSRWMTVIPPKIVFTGNLVSTERNSRKRKRSELTSEDVAPQLRFVPSVPQSQQDIFIASLSKLKLGFIEVLDTACRRFGAALLRPIGKELTRQIEWMQQYEGNDKQVRLGLYTLASTVCETIGTALGKPEVKCMDGLLKMACNDIAGSRSAIYPEINGNFSGTEKPEMHFSDLRKQDPTIHASAIGFLVSAITYLPSICLDPDTRTEVDRIAILTKSIELAAASTLWPAARRLKGQTSSSLLPLLVGLSDDGHRDPRIEGIIRPRVPQVYWRDLRSPDASVSDHEEENVAQMDGADSVDKAQMSTSATSPTDNIEGMNSTVSVPPIGSSEVEREFWDHTIGMTAAKQHINMSLPTTFHLEEQSPETGNMHTMSSTSEIATYFTPYDHVPISKWTANTVFERKPDGLKTVEDSTVQNASDSGGSEELPPINIGDFSDDSEQE